MRQQQNNQDTCSNHGSEYCSLDAILMDNIVDGLAFNTVYNSRTKYDILKFYDMYHDKKCVIFGA